MNNTPEKYNLLNPHPSETYKYSYRDMLDCWIAGRENLVRWGVGEGDKPDFCGWVKEYHSNKIKTVENHVEKNKDVGSTYMLNSFNLFPIPTVASLSFIGMTLEQAAENNGGWLVQPTIIDGKYIPISASLCPIRICVEVKNNIIAKITSVGL